MKTNTTIIRWIAVALTGAILAGCTLAPSAPPPEDHFYRLPDPHPGVLDVPVVQGTIGVAPLRAAGLYLERTMLYIDAGSPLEVRRYHYRYWFTAPGDLIQGHLADALRVAGVARKVIRYEPGAPVQGLVSGSIERFERINGPDGDQVRVALNLVYGDADRRRPPVVHQTYAITRPVSGRGTEDAVTAFGAALDRIYADFIHDLTVSMREDHP
jgi:cholesterol transport system auxiliary component